MTGLPERMLADLRLLYPDDADDVAAALVALLDEYRPRLASGGERRRFSQRDAVLITYADSLREPGRPPLQTLADLLPRITDGTISAVHLLPFFPWTSDDGFSVVDYLAVNPAVGTWADVAALGEQVELVFDAVVNHVSASSAWFAGFRAGDPAYADWFITVPAGTDTSVVVRPRTLPLLTPFEVTQADGGVVTSDIWTTFSADQIDLNYANPNVLLAVLGVLLEYAVRGASVLRLDAVTYLWKELGTTCVHLPQTHGAIRLARAALDELAPQVTLLTETNVPHEENISYFGDGHDEAQLVYNFALPPLVLHSFVAGDARALSGWASGLRTPSADVGFFNFLASHDGIGLRGAEGILSTDDLRALGDRALAAGGLVGLRTAADGTSVPYELNVNYFDALNPADDGAPLAEEVARFVTAHAVMLAMPGVPAIYVHSLLGSRGWPEGVAETGAARTVNREVLDRDALLTDLADADGRRCQVLSGLQRLLRARAAHPAFDPHAPSEVVHLGPSLFSIRRGSDTGSVLCVHNVTGQAVALDGGPWTDLITGESGVTQVDPWGARWLVDPRD